MEPSLALLHRVYYKSLVENKFCFNLAGSEVEEIHSFHSEKWEKSRGIFSDYASAHNR